MDVAKDISMLLIMKDKKDCCHRRKERHIVDFVNEFRQERQQHNASSRFVGTYKLSVVTSVKIYYFDFDCNIIL